jgi:type II secretory ATPase GspE/PulE/Tfp pilus assembly ATPase PilB-like protein
MTPEMQRLLSKPSRDLTTQLIEDVAVKDGMLTLEQDGALQALRGKTTYEEIYRVIG